MNTIVVVLSDFTMRHFERHSEVDWVFHVQSTGLIPYYAHEIFRSSASGFTVILAVDSRLEKEPNEYFARRFIDMFLKDLGAI